MLLRNPIARVLCLLVLAPNLAAADALLRGTAESLRTAPSAHIDGVPLLSPPLIAAFYGARGHACGWTRTEQVQALMDAVERSPSHGLDPDDFHAAVLRDLAQPGALARLKREPTTDVVPGVPSPSERMIALEEIRDKIFAALQQVKK